MRESEEQLIRESKARGFSSGRKRSPLCPSPGLSCVSEILHEDPHCQQKHQKLSSRVKDP
jgi:hypothetical protein